MHPLGDSGCSETRAKTTVYPAGTTIFEEGTEGHTMYAIKRGKVAVMVAGKAVNTLADEERERPCSSTRLGRPASSLSKKPSSGDRRATALIFVRQNPHFALQLMQLLSEGLRRADTLYKTSESGARQAALSGAMIVVTGGAPPRPRGRAVAAQRRLPGARRAAIVYVALGDSPVEGEGASSPDRNYVGRLYQRLRAVYPHARLVNLGVGGATAADVLSRQLPQALELRPYLVTLSVGPKYYPGAQSLGVRPRHRSHSRHADPVDDGVVVVNLIPDLTVTPPVQGQGDRGAGA